MERFRTVPKAIWDHPESWGGPAIWCRWNATVGTKNKTNFYVVPSPRHPQPRFSSDLAAHFGGGIRHYLERSKSTTKKGYLSSSLHSSSLCSQGGDRFGGKKEVDFTLRIVHGSFPRAPWESSNGTESPVIDREFLRRGFQFATTMDNGCVIVLKKN